MDNKNIERIINMKDVEDNKTYEIVNINSIGDYLDLAAKMGLYVGSKFLVFHQTATTLLLKMATQKIVVDNIFANQILVKEVKIQNEEAL